MWNLSSLTRDETHTPCSGRTDSFLFFKYLAVPGLSGGTRNLPSLWACGIFTFGMWYPFPDQGSDPSPWLWRLRVLTIGLPWTSLGSFVFEGLFESPTWLCPYQVLSRSLPRTDHVSPSCTELPFWWWFSHSVVSDSLQPDGL